MTLDFFAERDRLRALDRARHDWTRPEWGVRITKDGCGAPSESGGRNRQDPGTPGATATDCFRGIVTLPEPSRLVGAIEQPLKPAVPCESAHTPSLAHGRVTGRPWGTDRPVRSAVSAQSRRYSLDPHRALAWWARHGGDAA